MEFARKNRLVITEMYVHQNMSSYQIAKRLNTYPQKVLRALTFLGIDRRSYSDAQKVALESGAAMHPTEGKKLSQEHRDSIGSSRAEAYSRMTDAEKERMAQISKENWKKLGPEKQAEIRALALEQVRRASKEGSKTERFVMEGLRDEGYQVEFHKSGLAPGSNLEVDIFIPEIRTAIEIDGPQHFEPIWGEEKLRKQQQADVAKQGILISHGYKILRVRQIDKSISKTKMATLLQCIMQEVSAIADGKEQDSLIEIEVKDGQAVRI